MQTLSKARIYLTTAASVLTLLAADGATAAAPSIARIGEDGLSSRAHALPIGARLHLRGVPLFAGEAPATLDLERFRVWKRGARITLVGPQGREVLEPEPRGHFRGQVAGEGGSFVFASLDAAGSWRALVVARERILVLSWGEAAAGSEGAPRIREVDPARDLAGLAAGWSCANDTLTAPPGPSHGSSILRQIASPAWAARATGAPGAGATYGADLAVDTDWEFYALFGSMEGASGYVSDLVGTVAAVFLRDIDTALQLSDLFLYPEGPNLDPWRSTNIVNLLFEVRDYWQANRADIDRTLVHFLTGKILGGGVAFRGSLCDDVRGYGVSADLAGDFDPDSPSVVWDIVVVGHELGHAFGAPHTHCFNDYPLAGDPPIDMCYASEAGCYSGATGLPADGGSLMSYCHQQPGGIPNMRLWLGCQGFYGVRSERLPQRMRAYLDSVAACLPVPLEGLFGDGFESGDTSAWSLTRP